MSPFTPIPNTTEKQRTRVRRECREMRKNGFRTCTTCIYQYFTEVIDPFLVVIVVVDTERCFLFMNYSICIARFLLILLLLFPLRSLCTDTLWSNLLRTPWQSFPLQRKQLTIQTRPPRRSLRRRQLPGTTSSRLRPSRCCRSPLCPRPFEPEHTHTNTRMKIHMNIHMNIQYSAIECINTTQLEQTLIVEHDFNTIN